LFCHCIFVSQKDAYGVLTLIETYRSIEEAKILIEDTDGQVMFRIHNDLLSTMGKHIRTILDAPVPD
jgi:hypothetical protein